MLNMEIVTIPKAKVRKYANSYCVTVPIALIRSKIIEADKQYKLKLCEVDQL